MSVKILVDVDTLAKLLDEHESRFPSDPILTELRAQIERARETARRSIR